MNKLVIILSLGVMLTGCASAGTFRSEMQPDGSYRIVTGGNAFSNQKDARNQAIAEAESLCPSGYDVKSETAGSQGLKPRYRMIIKCS